MPNSQWYWGDVGHHSTRKQLRLINWFQVSLSRLVSKNTFLVAPCSLWALIIESNKLTLQFLRWPHGASTSAQSVVSHPAKVRHQVGTIQVEQTLFYNATRNHVWNSRYSTPPPADSRHGHREVKRSRHPKSLLHKQWKVGFLFLIIGWCDFCGEKEDLKDSN